MDRPPARALASSCVIDSKMYVFGGWGETGLLRDLWCLDCSRKGQWEWKKLPTTDLKPDPRCKATLTALKEKKCLFLFGGGSAKDDVAFNDAFMYNLGKEKWEKVQMQGTPPTPRTGHSAVLYKNLILVFGGCRREGDRWNCFNSLHIFELNGNQWIEPPQSTEVRTKARKHHISFTNDDILYLCGGKTSLNGGSPDSNKGLPPKKVYSVNILEAFGKLVR